MTPDLEDVFTVLGMDLLCDRLTLILSWRIRKKDFLKNPG